MEEIFNKQQVFIVQIGDYLGLPIKGLTIIPAVVHQQHGGKVHCFIELDKSNDKVMVTVNKQDVCLNINDAMTVVNSVLLTSNSTTNELDRKSSNS